jgi:hypothetical protein
MRHLRSATGAGAPTSKPHLAATWSAADHTPLGRRELSSRRKAFGELGATLEAVRAGQSAALMVRGEPGIGKAVLDRQSAALSGFRVIRVLGVKSEKDLPFAGLHQLCAQLLDRVDQLSDPQRDVLREAFVPTAAATPDRFLVALAVFSLLSQVAEGQPLVCVIEDAQWLDRPTAQALAFVARRLVAESVALVFAVRGSSEAHEFARVPELVVGDLRPAAAAGELRTSVHPEFAG